MVKNADKPRGRVSSYAFFLKKAKEESKTKIDFKDFSRQCAERWKSMSETEKKKYVTMANKDAKRYEAEMRDYVPPKGGDKGKKGKRSKKDPNAPKRALSAFFLYSNDERAKVKAALGPNSTVGDVSKELGKKWKAISPAVKANYEQLAQKEKAKYQKELKAYEAKGGSGSSSGKASKKQPAKSKKQVESSEDESEEEEEEEEEDEDDDEDEDDE